jgi:hypothetical protein
VEAWVVVWRQLVGEEVSRVIGCGEARGQWWQATIEEKSRAHNCGGEARGLRRQPTTEEKDGDPRWVAAEENPTLREKGSFETCPQEEWRHADRASPSSCLALQSHQRHVAGRVSD